MPIDRDLMDLLTETGALLDGHFLLSSGLHSNRYVQCAKLLRYPDKAERVCGMLADMWRDRKIDKVVGPAVGAIIVAYELARHLGCEGIFTERMDGKMVLRRGFHVAPSDRILLAEDVVTTGASAGEVAEYLRSLGADVVGLAAIIDRSAARPAFVEDFRSLGRLELTTFRPEECPICRAGGVPVRPGSRPKL